MASLFKSMIVRILICFEISSLFFTSTMGMADFTDGFGRGSTKRFCGRMLTESLALICNNEYETIIHPSKRSDEIFDEYAYSDQPAQLMEEPLPYPYQSYAYLAKLAPEAARGNARVRRDWVARRGVYDECCRKPCSVQELRNYCKRKN